MLNLKKNMKTKAIISNFQVSNTDNLCACACFSMIPTLSPCDARLNQNSYVNIFLLICLKLDNRIYNINKKYFTFKLYNQFILCEIKVL